MGRATPWLSQAQGLGTQVRVGRESTSGPLSKELVQHSSALCPLGDENPKVPVIGQ